MTLNNIKIGFDLDGVILDHTYPKIALSKEMGYTLAPNETSSGVMRDKMKLEDYRSLQTLLYDDPLLSQQSDLMDGSLDVLLYLKENFPIWLISRRKRPESAITLLEKHGVWGSVFDENNSYFVKDAYEKNEISKHLSINHYIDDEERVLKELIDVEQRFLFDPHNVSENTDFSKFGRWSEIQLFFNKKPLN